MAVAARATMGWEAGILRESLANRNESRSQSRAAGSSSGPGRAARDDETLGLGGLVVRARATRWWQLGAVR